MTTAPSLAPSPGADIASSFRERTHGRHYPALDGLRGVAFLAVFLSHFYAMIVPASRLSWGGWLGVDLFFVLSGFLITGILYDARTERRYFRNFYVRRALRIFPLYYSVWIVFLLLTPWLHPLWNRFDIGRVLYVANLMTFSAARHPEVNATGFFFYFPKGHLTGFNVGHLWSLCLEEQFYLVWPMLVYLVRDRRRIMAVCVLGVAGSFVLNTVLLHWAVRVHAERSFLYVATYAHVGPMLFGAWLALWLRGRSASEPVGRAVYLSWTLGAAALLCALTGLLSHPFDPLSASLPTQGYLCSGLMGATLVLACISSRGLTRRIMSQPWLTRIGKISYGMYIFHGFLLGSFSHHLDWFARRHVLLLVPISAFAITFVAASLSFRFLERPFLRMKDRLAPTLSSGGRDVAIGIGTAL